MPYTNCAACGAKALVGATRCPRCQAPFVSYEFGGERVVTVNCPNCGVQRPVAIGVCPNCLMSTAPSGRRLVRGLTLAGLGIAAILTVGYLISRNIEQTKPTPGSAYTTADTGEAAALLPPDDSAVLASSDTSARTASAAVAPVAASVATTVPAAASSATIPAATLAVPPVAAAKVALPKPANPRIAAPPPSVAVPDTGRWEDATANTWVRVRAAPTRESAVLRIVDPRQRVRLGPPRSGWRPIRVGGDRGWVDPHFFTVVRTRRP